MRTLLLAGVAVLPLLYATGAHAEVKPELEVCIVADPTDTPPNVRNKPNGVVLGALHNNTKVIVTDRTIVGPPDKSYRWFKIVPFEGGKTGWVFGAYLDCGLPAFIKAKDAAKAPTPSFICATVSPPENDDLKWGEGTVGYLNVREKPDAKSKVVDALHGYDVVWIDDDPLIDRFPGWKHIYHLTAEGFEKGKGEYPVNGWVRDKFLKIGEGSCPSPDNDTWSTNLRPKRKIP
jgi:hypothetical protein